MCVQIKQFRSLSPRQALPLSQALKHEVKHSFAKRTLYRNRHYLPRSWMQTSQRERTVAAPELPSPARSSKSEPAHATTYFSRSKDSTSAAPADLGAESSPAGAGCRQWDQAAVTRRQSARTKPAPLLCPPEVSPRRRAAGVGSSEHGPKCGTRIPGAAKAPPPTSFAAWHDDIAARTARNFVLVWLPDGQDSKQHGRRKKKEKKKRTEL